MIHRHLMLIMMVGAFFSVMPSAAHAQPVCNLDGIGHTSQVIDCVEGVLEEVTLILLEAISN